MRGRTASHDPCAVQDAVEKFAVISSNDCSWRPLLSGTERQRRNAAAGGAYRDSVGSEEFCALDISYTCNALRSIRAWSLPVVADLAVSSNAEEVTKAVRNLLRSQFLPSAHAILAGRFARVLERPRCRLFS